MDILTSVASPMRIRCIYIQGASCGTSRSASTPWRDLFVRLDDLQRHHLTLNLALNRNPIRIVPHTNELSISSKTNETILRTFAYPLPAAPYGLV